MIVLADWECRFRKRGIQIFSKQCFDVNAAHPTPIFFENWVGGWGKKRCLSFIASHNNHRK